MLIIRLREVGRLSDHLNPEMLLTVDLQHLCDLVRSGVQGNVLHTAGICSSIIFLVHLEVYGALHCERPACGIHLFHTWNNTPMRACQSSAPVYSTLSLVPALQTTLIPILLFLLSTEQSSNLQVYKPTGAWSETFQHSSQTFLEMYYKVNGKKKQECEKSTTDNFPIVKGV